MFFLTEVQITYFMCGVGDAATGHSFFLHLWHMRQNKHQIRPLHTNTLLTTNKHMFEIQLRFCCRGYFLPTFLC